MLIFNLELMPFMDYDTTNNFYLKLKKIKYSIIIYINFFFEITWFSPKLGKNKKIKNIKYPFVLWSYYNKLKKKINKDNFYDTSDIEKYIGTQL